MADALSAGGPETSCRPTDGTSRVSTSGLARLQAYDDVGGEQFPAGGVAEAVDEPREVLAGAGAATPLTVTTAA